MKQIIKRDFVLALYFVFLIFFCIWGFFQPNPMDLSMSICRISIQHPLGCDLNGRDILIFLAQGTWNSLKLSILVSIISLVLGSIIGLISGYLGGNLDNMLMRITEIFLAFPGFLLNLFIVSILGPSFLNMVLALCITSWTSFARIVRSKTSMLKNEDYVQAAIALGANPARILFFHISPQLLGTLLVQLSLAMVQIILIESALQYLGLGSGLLEPSWGQLLNSGRKVLDTAPLISISAAACIFVLLLSLMKLSNRLKQSFGI